MAEFNSNSNIITRLRGLYHDGVNNHDGAINYDANGTLDIFVIRESNSNIHISSTTNSTSKTNRLFNSNLLITSFLKSSILHTTRTFNSTINNFFSGISDGRAIRAFNSNSVTIFSIISDIKCTREFNSTSQIISTNLCYVYVLRKFNSESNLQIPISTFANVIREMNSSLNILTTTISDIEYFIVNNKKLQYLIDSFVSGNIQHNTPKFKDFIYSFLKYLDRNSN